MASVKPPYLGAAYYPEDWPLEQIDEDIALMKKAGMNVMRVGEFAWSRMEPEEGRFDFSWLHLAVDKLGKAGIATIMGTPTCTPPIWLVTKHPEVLVVGEDGVRQQHGARRHGCPNSPVYRDYCAQIVQVLAKEFGKDPNIIGWQIDNELYFSTPRGCCCPVCHQKFQQAMKARFGTIEALNAAWGMDLWSQTYQSFDQLPIPLSRTWHHPSLLTAWMVFQSDSYVDFCNHQADLLHKAVKQPVGTDMMPFSGVNYQHIHEKLDLVQYNHYHGMENFWENAFWCDFIRPLKPAPFWNTETATCWGGATTANGYKEPGFCRANSWLPLAMGGEANLYWLWRSHWSGQELMHGSVVTSAGRPMHIFDEVQEISRGFDAVREFLNGTRPIQTGVALHFSGFAWWLFEFQPLVHGFHYAASLMRQVYHPMIEVQLRPDVIDPASSLDGYRLLFSPFLPALDEAGLKDRLRAWIESGGVWVVGPMSDIRTMEATKFRHAPFGVLEDWAGIRCDYDIPGDPRQFSLQWSDSTPSEGSIWYHGLKTVDAEVLATYTEGPFEGLAAVTTKKLGKGRIIVLGTLPTPEDLKSVLLTIAQEAGVSPVADATGNLMVVPREGKAGKGMILVEMLNQTASITLREPVTDLLTGKTHSGMVDVPPYGVLVLKKA